MDKKKKKTEVLRKENELLYPDKNILERVRNDKGIWFCEETRTRSTWFYTSKQRFDICNQKSIIISVKVSKEALQQRKENISESTGFHLE